MSELRSDAGLSADAGEGLRFAVVVSRFNEDITSRLCDAALETLAAHGVDDEDVLVVDVPGAFELPMAALAAAGSGEVDGVVCIGALIRGETSHFDVLAHSVALAIQNAFRETGVPMSFGVITCENREQAEARAGGVHGNKGVEAALAALEMALLLRPE